MLSLPEQRSHKQSCGWFPVTDTARADTDTTTHDRSVELAADVPTVVWTERPVDPRGSCLPHRVRRIVDPAEQVALIAELFVAADVKAGTLTDDEIAEAFPAVPPWKPGIAVAVGEVYRWDGTLVEVIQAHTTQADWTPDMVSALFKIHVRQAQPRTVGAARQHQTLHDR